MNDTIIDDVFKSDVYSISINQLLFTKLLRPNLVSVGRLLDNNGYFGRHRIEEVKDKKFGKDTLIKIHVYLVDSSFEYSWPFNTFFDLDKRIFGHNRKLSRGVFTDKFMFNHCVGVLALMSTTKKIEDAESHYEAVCIKCRDIIKRNNLGIEDWSWVICNNHGTLGQLTFYEKIIPFLSRIGMIHNNKLKLQSMDDALEFCENLFDVNYWQNI